MRHAVWKSLLEEAKTSIAVRKETKLHCLEKKLSNCLKVVKCTPGFKLL